MNELIRKFDPKYYFIENPRGKLRKLPIMDEHTSLERQLRIAVTETIE